MIDVIDDVIDNVIDDAIDDVIDDMNFRVEKSKCSLSVKNDFRKVKMGLP